jgi:hypothetical protein
MKRRECSEKEILNPVTKRCVKRDGNIGKLLLREESCKRINLGWDKNSCYIDSLLVGLMYDNDIKYLTESKIKDYGDSKLLKLGEDIRDNLIKLHKIINDRISSDGKSEMIKLRSNLNKYYKKYKIINSKINIIDKNDNWITTDLDVFELFELLLLIFDIKPHTVIKDGDMTINTTFDYMVPMDLLAKKEIKIRDVIPVYTTIYKLGKDNALIDKMGKKIYRYKKRTEIKKTDRLFVKIYRNNGISKINTRINVSKSIKISGNREKLNIKAIIIHYGSNKGGHYICLINCHNKWYEYDDMSSKMKYIGKLSDINNKNEYIENIVGMIYI